jgi:hypothetical protein
VSEEPPESQAGQPTSPPPPAVQAPGVGPGDGAPHISGHVHAHHSAINFRFLEQLKHRNIIRVALTINITGESYRGVKARKLASKKKDA